MIISKKDYFFYEWLIVGKKISEEKFKQLKPTEIKALKTEYSKFERTEKQSE